jgi:all-trans-retinol dehydrogenase (NAD+)
VNPTWVRTPLIGPLIADPTFNDLVLEPEVVSTAIVKAVLSGRSNHVILPSFYGPVAGIRGWPAWLSEALRNRLGYLMDVRVRFGGKFKRDSRLDGGSIDDLKI